ncbi:MFS transporter (plasmid) [Haloferacaceae archaeon DSL9]
MASTARNDRLVLFTLWLVVFCFSSQTMIIAPILPRVAGELAVAESTLGTLITVYAVSVAVFALVAGPISDAIGRQRMLALGTASMTGALVLHGLVWNFGSFLGVRAIAGVAGGMLAGASVAYVGDYFPPERRGWANGWVMSGLAAGQILGIPIGTILAARFGFRTPFLAFALAMAVTAALVVLTLPRIPISNSEPLSVRSAAGEYATLLRRTDVVAAVVGFALMFMGISLYVAYLPTWLEASHGVAGVTIALLFFFGGIGNAIAGPQSGKLSDSVGRKRVIVAASFAIAVAMLVTLAVTSTVWGIFALFVVVMALLASRASPFQAMLTEMVPDTHRGSLMSLSMAVGQLGFGIGGALAGPLYVITGYAGTVVVAAATGLLLVPLAWRYFPDAVDAAGEDERAMAERRRHAVPTGGGQDTLCGPLPEGGHCAALTESASEGTGRVTRR